MFRAISRASFLVGVLIGVFLAIILKINEHSVINVKPPTVRPFQLERYKKWFSGAKLGRQRVSFDAIRYGNKTYFPESSYLYSRVTVLCVILVKTPKNAQAARATWAKHCNEVRELNVTIERKKIPIKRDKEESSWVVLCRALHHVPHAFKWILIVHDYTFVLVENLRLLLAGLDHHDNYYLGHAVQFWSTVYNMGQAGYVLSKGSVKTLNDKLNLSDSCMEKFAYMNREDYYLGKHLALANVKPADTRDWNGLSTFYPYNLHHVFFPNGNTLSVFPQKCCSPHLIAFQAIEGDKMYTYYYLLHTVQLFQHGHFGNKRPVNPYADEEVWKNFLKMRDLPQGISAEQYYKIWENLVDDPTSFARHMKREEYFDYV